MSSSSFIDIVVVAISIVVIIVHQVDLFMQDLQPMLDKSQLRLRVRNLSRGAGGGGCRWLRKG